MRDLIIKKGGTLWNKDTNKDITEDAPRYLFEQCELDNDVTLKDIFLLLNSNIVVFNLILGNWLEEIVHEGLTKPEVVYDKEIEYLELYWFLESWDFDEVKTLDGFMFPSFHGVGFEQKEDKYINDDKQEHNLECKKGERINWAVEFTPTNELINIPLKLRDKIEFCDNITKEKDIKKSWKMTEYKEASFTLGHILHGIIYELSFTGSPEDRNKFGEDLKKTIKDINTGKEELIHCDDLDDMIKKLNED